MLTEHLLQAGRWEYSDNPYEAYFLDSAQTKDKYMSRSVNNHWGKFQKRNQQAAKLVSAGIGTHFR